MKKLFSLTSIKLSVSLVLVFAMALTFTGCKLTDLIFGGSDETDDISSSIESDPVNPESSDESETTADPAETQEETTAEDTAGDESSSDETTAEIEVPTYLDPLTGLYTEINYSKVRPVSISIDNLSSTAPQTGIARADILIEAMVEGGISRLLLITNKYSASEVYGPIRSTRDYLVSLSQAFGTLMVGAGYSPTGYTSIVDNGLNYIDGTHDRYALSGFFRDPIRYKSSGYEHSLMITGQGIKALATINNYPVTVSSVDKAFNFAKPDKQVSLSGGAATHCILTYSVYQQIQMIYSRKDNSYYRYQYGTTPHLDAETGEQLNFTNVFILFANQEKIAGDTEGRLSVELTGSGTGYYLTGGKYIEINWTRSGFTSDFKFTDASGNSFSVNCGKTFITVVDSSLKGTDNIILNYKVS